MTTLADYGPLPPPEKLRALLEAAKAWRNAEISPMDLINAVDAAYPPEPKSKLNKRHRDFLMDLTVHLQQLEIDLWWAEKLSYLLNEAETA